VTSQHNPTGRFSNRVANYVRYRPRYPAGVIDLLRHEAGLRPDHVVADVGSGTGFSAELFLRYGCTVYGVEPNEAMRAAGEEYLAAWPRFHSVEGTAEATTLPAASVDWIAAGQAFHWFDLERSRAEFARILQPGGQAVLLWNTRREDASPFMRDYEALLAAHSQEYREVYHTNITNEQIMAWFEPSLRALPTYRTLPNPQSLGWDALRGRTLSSSYMPAEGTPAAAEVERDLRALFDRYAVGGEVRYDYTTEVYFGRLAR
jgi:SAM-dependent methyltransferase